MRYLVQHNDGAEVIEAASFRIDCEGVLIMEQRPEGDDADESWERVNTHAFAYDYWQRIQPVVEDAAPAKDEPVRDTWDMVKERLMEQERDVPMFNWSANAS